METWTEQALKLAYPLGTVYTQTDDAVEPMGPVEWQAWIDGQVGMPIHPVDASGPQQ